MKKLDKNRKEKIYKYIFVFALIFLFLVSIYFGSYLGYVYARGDYSNIFSCIYGAFKNLIHFEKMNINIIKNEPLKFILGICISILISALVLVISYLSSKNGKHYKRDESYGTAIWNSDYKKYNEKYVDKENLNNMILTKNIKLNMDTFVTKKNNNVLVIGGSGSGKSRSFVKPNILEKNANYIITDPSGELLQSTGFFLKNEGYDIKVFNLIDMNKGDRYNPFRYIKSESDIVKMVHCLIKNTTKKNEISSDGFWVKGEEMLLSSICMLLWKFGSEKEKNFSKVLEVLRLCETSKDDSFRELDDYFKIKIKGTYENEMCYRIYKQFKMAEVKVRQGILISLFVRLNIFNIKEVRNLTSIDTMDLDKMGEGKKAIFVIIPSSDDTYNFLSAMMYSQLFDTLYNEAAKNDNKKLNRHVRFILDEFANIGEIPNFTELLSTMRKFNISCSIILQNLAQLKERYRNDFQTIIGNCSSFLFLGGQEIETAKYISSKLGKRTIVVENMSKNKKGSSNTYNQTSRELLFADEITRIDYEKCILLIEGLMPFYDYKFNLEEHEKYKYTYDYSKENKYEIIEYKNEEKEEAKINKNSKIFSEFVEWLEVKGNDNE